MSPRSNSARPASPQWDTNRQFLTGAFLRDPPSLPSPSLASYPENTQHKLASEDALNALLALRPSFAIVDPGQTPVYSPHNLEPAHPEISPLLSRILPLATHHAIVKNFIESTRLPHHGSGHVLQAVGVALSTLLSDYNAFILRLEDAILANELSLQKLLYYVQPSARSMALLRNIAHTMESRKGGAALDSLYNLAVSHVGTQDSRDVLAFVLSQASAPIFDIMHRWLRTGVIDDPFSEFFIVHDNRLASQQTANAWQMRYTVNTDNIPAFLGPFVEKILRAGKYLNVLRECDIDTSTALSQAQQRVAPLSTEQPTFDYLSLSDIDLLAPDASRQIARVVDTSFSLATSALMSHLEASVRIKERLRSMKRFFLLERSDYLVHFFDAAASELSKDRTEVSRSKLASLLDLSIRTSVSAADPFQDDLTCKLCSDPLASLVSVMSQRGGSATTASKDDSTSSSGYECFALDYRLQWPISLIVSQMEVLKYQFMFRYLFYCKHVERELEECWRHHSQAKAPLRHLPGSFVRSFALRNRMMQFVRNILYYTLVDVIEPNWRSLEAAMRKSETIDEIMHHHALFLDSSVTQSLLSNEKHLRVFKSISETCISFAAYTEIFSDAFGSSNSAEEIENDLQERNYPGTLAKFETSFDMHLGRLLDGLSAVSKKRANIHLANLCERLDVGGYYGRLKERTLASFGSLEI